ncbi:hypothetical protein CRYUN_Cryun39dG0011800 [Craigia yunnanensis]
MLQYCRITSEPALVIETNRPERSWPFHGEITIFNLQVMKLYYVYDSDSCVVFELNGDDRCSSITSVCPTFATRLAGCDMHVSGRVENRHCRENRQRGLEVLDLGNNRINDTFPRWSRSLPQLQVLVLRSNQLQGCIQDTRSSLSFSKIQIFYLSSNYFTGTLPVRYIKIFKAIMNLTKNESAMRYMGVSDPKSIRFYSYYIGIAIKGVEMEMVKFFTMLTSIDLSNNKFQGEIPKVIGKLNSLKGLNLSHNDLSGCIPTSIGNLISLEWLDLSSNKLVGTIPVSLLDLTFLSIFNVSENQLEGRIPQGKHFNTFGNDSFEGNNRLCGFPISKGCINSEPPLLTWWKKMAQNRTLFLPGK